MVTGPVLNTGARDYDGSSFGKMKDGERNQPWSNADATSGWGGANAHLRPRLQERCQGSWALHCCTGKGGWGSTVPMNSFLRAFNCMLSPWYLEMQYKDSPVCSFLVVFLTERCQRKTDRTLLQQQSLRAFLPPTEQRETFQSGLFPFLIFCLSFPPPWSLLSLCAISPLLFFVPFLSVSSFPFSHPTTGSCPPDYSPSDDELKDCHFSYGKRARLYFLSERKLVVGVLSWP